MKRDIEQKIREINGTMAVEDMPLTEQDKQRLRDIASGKITYKEMFKKLVLKHSQNNINMPNAK
jgi:hypothetical protein